MSENARAETSSAGMKSLVQFCEDFQEALDMATGLAEPVATEHAELVLAAGRLMALTPGVDDAMRDAAVLAPLERALDSVRGPVAAIRSAASRTERGRHLFILEEICGAQLDAFTDLCCQLVPDCLPEFVNFRLSNLAQQTTLIQLRSDVAHELARLDDMLTENYALDEKRAAAYERRLADYAAKVDRKLAGHEVLIEAQQKNAKEAGEHLDKAMERAKAMVKGLGEHAARKELERVRDRERVQAERWRLISIWVGIGFFAILTAISLLDRSLPVTSALAARIPIATFASAVLAFTVRQSHVHRRDERKYRENIIRMDEVNYFADQSPDEYSATKQKVLNDLMAGWVTWSNVNLRQELNNSSRPSRRNLLAGTRNRKINGENSPPDDDSSRIDADR